VIAIRPARPTDAVAIGAVHVAAWRSAYAGILPDEYLANLSVSRYAAFYDQAIHSTGGVFVALPGQSNHKHAGAPRVVGFATAGRARVGSAVNGHYLAEGEIETLYVLDDWREQGIGRRLMLAAAAQLAEHGCRSVFLWVLRDNPSRWFYERLGGKPAAECPIRFAGRDLIQTAFVWDPIERLLAASPQES
jgi:ribosomal protein S18 acetylase RimI-like enzyme